MKWAKVMPSKVQWVSIVALITSAGMLGFSGYMLYNIDVLQDWTIELPEEPIHVGDKIVINSLYTKVRDASGTSTRSLDCKNKDGIYIRVPLNEAEANRAVGKKGTGITIVMPEIPDVPTTCKIAIAIKYDVIRVGNLVLRQVPESNESDEFTLYPKREEKKEAEDVSTETSQTPAVASGVSGPSSSVASSSKSTPAPQTAQSNTSQKQETATPTNPTNPTTTTPPPEPEPSILERLIDNILGGN